MASLISVVAPLPQIIATADISTDLYVTATQKRIYVEFLEESSIRLDEI